MAPKTVSVVLKYSKPGTQPPIYLAGSFSSPAWQPQEMQNIVNEQNEHEFSKEVEVEEGKEYQYKFRIGAGDWWILNEDFPTVTDDIGNRNNLLLVPLHEESKKETEEATEGIRIPLADKRNSTTTTTMEPTQAERAMDTEIDPAIPAIKQTVSSLSPTTLATQVGDNKVTKQSHNSLANEGASSNAVTMGKMQAENTGETIGDSEINYSVATKLESTNKPKTSGLSLTEKASFPTVAIEKTSLEPRHVDATFAQKDAHRLYPQDTEPDSELIRKQSRTPELAGVAADVADSAAILDRDRPEPAISDEEAGRIGFRRMSQTPIPEVADTAAEVADVAAVLDKDNELEIESPSASLIPKEINGIYGESNVGANSGIYLQQGPLLSHVGEKSELTEEESRGSQAEEKAHKEKADEELRMPKIDTLPCFLWERPKPLSDAELHKLLSAPFTEAEKKRELNRLVSREEDANYKVEWTESKIQESRESGGGEEGINRLRSCLPIAHKDYRPFDNKQAAETATLKRYLERSRVKVQDELASMHSNERSSSLGSIGEEEEEEEVVVVKQSEPNVKVQEVRPESSEGNIDDMAEDKDNLVVDKKAEEVGEPWTTPECDGDVDKQNEPTLDVRENHPESPSVNSTTKDEGDQAVVKNGDQGVEQLFGHKDKYVREKSKGDEGPNITVQPATPGSSSMETASLSRSLDKAKSTGIEEENSHAKLKSRRKSVGEATPDRPLTPTSMRSAGKDAKNKNFLKAFWRVVFVDWIGGLIMRLCGGYRRGHTLLTVGAIILVTVAPALYFRS